MPTQTKICPCCRTQVSRTIPSVQNLKHWVKSGKRISSLRGSPLWGTDYWINGQPVPEAMAREYAADLIRDWEFD